jgi:hypothetical protein
MYCDVFGGKPSLLGNCKVKILSLLGTRKLNTSMDTLAGPVLLRCIATKSRKASVPVGPAGCYIEKTTEKLASQFRKDIRSEQISSVSE